ncbi:hypothetical protein GGX14DRAFT_643668 [Mycena pura]|uniref:Uncharacterized protein n=1 Tax=Mycena pura TaxID=153505 RepID=A0AAD6VDC8_9AGAR|nr:hypothetical protein GGX14DRAFT_643668 [Mycena pura]
MHAAPAVCTSPSAHSPRPLHAARPRPLHAAPALCMLPYCQPAAPAFSARSPSLHAAPTLCTPPPPSPAVHTPLMPSALFARHPRHVHLHVPTSSARHTGPLHAASSLPAAPVFSARSPCPLHAAPALCMPPAHRLCPPLFPCRPVICTPPLVLSEDEWVLSCVSFTISMTCSPLTRFSMQMHSFSGARARALAHNSRQQCYMHIVQRAIAAVTSMCREHNKYAAGACLTNTSLQSRMPRVA